MRENKREKVWNQQYSFGDTERDRKIDEIVESGPKRLLKRIFRRK